MKLLPCPFCGKLPKIYQKESCDRGWPIAVGWAVRCTGCHVVKESDFEELAIEYWNTRFDFEKEKICVSQNQKV